MSTFTPLEGPPDAEMAAAEAWLRERLEAERTARRLPAQFGWDVQRGRRGAGLPSGPILAQVGFLIHVIDAPGGAAGPLPCFVAADDIADEEQRVVVQHVLSLWLDRVIG